MLKRAWIVIALPWSLLWIGGLLIANAGQSIDPVVGVGATLVGLAPWILGLAVRWIVAGSLRSGVDDVDGDGDY